MKSLNAINECRVFSASKSGFNRFKQLMNVWNKSYVVASLFNNLRITNRLLSINLGSSAMISLGVYLIKEGSLFSG